MPPNIENDELQKSPVLLLKNVFAVMNYKTLREVWHLRISNIERVLTLTYIKHRERFDTYVYKTSREVLHKKKTSREVWQLRTKNIERGLTLTYCFSSHMKQRYKYHKYYRRKHTLIYCQNIHSTTKETTKLCIGICGTSHYRKSKTNFNWLTHFTLKSFY